MEVLLLLAIFAVAATVACLTTAVSGYQVRRGRFVVSRDSNGGTSIETDFGRFSFQAGRGFIAKPHSGPDRRVPLDSVIGVRYSYSVREATATETPYGPNLWDMFSAYRDRMETYEILIVTSVDAIPIFAATQLERREPLWPWWNDFVTSTLTRWRMIERADCVAQRALDDVLESLRSAGRPVGLC